MNKLISIIMPVFNRQDFLPYTLSSIEAQNYKSWQLIIVDDGSNDESINIAREFSIKHFGKCTIIRSAHRQSGAAACRNIGLKSANGDFIIFMDSDDSLEPFCFAQRIAIMKDHPLLDWAIFMQYEWYPAKEGPYNLFSKPIQSKEEAIKYFLQMDPPWQTMAPLWKKNTLIKLGGFDENLFYMEDPDLHLRALLDKNLNFTIKSDLPADCYYRISNIDELKLSSFYRHSIISRFHFLSKVLQFLPAIAPPDSLKEYYKYIRHGFLNFIKVFLLARFREHNKEFKEITRQLFKAKILTLKDILIISTVSSIFSSDSMILRKFRIRGLIKNLLFNEYWTKVKRRII